MNKLTGAVVASVVAGLFAANAFAASTTKDSKDSSKDAKTTNSKVKCIGVNACKGKGECSQDDHGCSGDNSCKGKGWVTVDSEKICKDKGGSIFTEAKADMKATPAPKTK